MKTLALIFLVVWLSLFGCVGWKTIWSQNPRGISRVQDHPDPAGMSKSEQPDSLSGTRGGSVERGGPGNGTNDADIQ